jgi:iron-sulfur cluster repair protein YtfE (RIC family)
MKATELLKKQHRQAAAQLKKILGSEDGDERRKLMEDLTHQLQQHTKIEEEIFYPAFREAANTQKASALVCESFEEHHLVDVLLAEIPKLDPNDERYDAKVTVLKEVIEHHVEEEQDEMFPAERLEELAVEMQRMLGEVPPGEDE